VTASLAAAWRHVASQASMKRHVADRVLSRVLNARQFGLKMIANVT
jgi:hypothetical protein